MAKEVILMQDIEGLGSEGDVVKAADGYVRNYLLPKSLAAPVTDATRRRLEKQRRERAVEVVTERADAEKLKAMVEQTSCTIAVKTAAEGQLFGSVGTTEIVAALKDQGVKLDKKLLLLDAPIRELGVFKIPVKLHPDIQATLKVWVVEE